MLTEEFSNIIATLVINGFHIHQVDRFSPDNPIISIYRYDKLGAEVRYSILFSSDKIETPILDVLVKVAKNYSSKPIIVSDTLDKLPLTLYKSKQFFDFFGGIVNTGLILISNLSEILEDLGHNQLPFGLTGTPEELLEIYSSECFQFIFESPTRRYGSDRLFEKLPDGVILCKSRFMILFDAKAYKDGFDIKSDDINRFAFYINDFNTRYGSDFGNIFSIVIVSGHFVDSEESISNRSSELYQLCNCKLSCINGKVLGDIVQIAKENPELRGAINWKSVFSHLIIETKYVQKEISRIQKDKLH
jgi:hypothetical protein